MSLMNNNDRQAELDAVRQKIADAVKANDAAAFSSALTEYGQLIETSILAEAEKSADAKIQAATQHIDSEVLRSRGVRQLTSAETGYWQKVTEAMKSTNPKQALEDLDEFGSLEELPFASLDLAMFKNGDLSVISCFDAAHRLGNFTGPPLEAVVDTAEQGGDRMMVHGLRPLVDGGAAEALPVYRTREMDARRFGAYTRQQRDGVCYQHLSTVYLAARVRIPAGENWSHAVGVEALVEREGGM